MVKLKELLNEKTIRLSTMKDANFQPGRFVQIIGKKGKVTLDKKSVKTLAKIVRTSKEVGMGYSFTTEEKLNEVKVVKLPNGVKVKVEFKGITFMGGTKPVFLNRDEMLNFFKGTRKYLKEENITEGKADRAFTKIIGLLRKESRKLNDDDSYELSTKLKAWFNKNVM